MAEVIWPEETLDRLYAIIAYIRLFDPPAATRMFDAMTRLGDSLAEYPNRGRPGQHGTRELVTVPPYVMIYEVTGSRVTILDIRHGRQRPR